MECLYCKAPGATAYCGDCDKVAYCGQECAKADHPQHRRECLSLITMIEAGHDPEPIGRRYTPGGLKLHLKKGAFTAKAKAHGMTVNKYSNQVLHHHHKEGQKLSPAELKLHREAAFAKAAKKWHH